MSEAPDIEGFRQFLIKRAGDPSNDMGPKERALYALLSVPVRAQAQCSTDESEFVIQSVAAAIEAAVVRATGGGNEP